MSQLTVCISSSHIYSSAGAASIYHIHWSTCEDAFAVAVEAGPDDPRVDAVHRHVGARFLVEPTARKGKAASLIIQLKIVVVSTADDAEGERGTVSTCRRAASSRVCSTLASLDTAYACVAS